MAKHKRKPSWAQRDKDVIAAAKKLKAEGILSKQTKLHGGKFVSRGVLKKVKELQFVARNDYKAYDATKAQVALAKARGFMTVGGTKIVGPKTPEFRKRISGGMVTGISPVKGGFLEKVVLPYDIWNMRAMTEKLTLEEIDALKLPHEGFAFMYHGNLSLSTFESTEQMINKILEYKSFDLTSLKPEELQEEFDGLAIYRLHKNDRYQLIPDQNKRQKMKKLRPRVDVEGKNTNRRKRDYYKLEDINPLEANKIRKKKREWQQKHRAKLAKDPKKLAEYKERARIRAKASYDKMKSK